MRPRDYAVVSVLIGLGVILAVVLSGPRRTGPMAGSPTGMDALEARLHGLEARVVALEGAPIREGAPAPEAWTEADVEALRVGLEKVKAAEQRDRGAQRLRNVIAHVVPDAEPALRDEAVDLLVETIEAADADPGRAEALRAELLAKLRERFPPAIAGRLAGLVPVEAPSEGPR